MYCSKIAQIEIQMYIKVKSWKIKENEFYSIYLGDI